MHIISHVDLTPAQEHAIEAFERAIVEEQSQYLVVNGECLECIVATFKTFQGQEVKITLDKNGVINHVEFAA